MSNITDITDNNDTNIEAPKLAKELRLWPGIAAAILLCVCQFIIPLIITDSIIIAIVGGLAAALIIDIWWLFFSRAGWVVRLAAIALMPISAIAISRLVHKSIANAGMGNMFYIYAIPAMSLALVVGVVVSKYLPAKFRRATILASVVIGCSVFLLVRTGGVSGAGVSDIHWRWTPSPEERLISQASHEPDVTVPSNASEPANPQLVPALNTEAPSTPASPSAETAKDATPAATPAEAAKNAVDWPGFRGPRRDGIVRGVRIDPDWTQSPPVQLWRKPIGPGWSSFAVHSDLCYTQEQRGEDELVACYKVATGEPVWRHRDSVRFWESNGGAGPRATPTLSNGRVYTFGATGILNALNASTGALIWTRNVASETNTKVPQWGFSSSPLVIDNLVIVAASGKLAAYDAASGQPRWTGQAHGGSYSSPHRTTIDGVQQILLESGTGLTSLVPATGALLWEYSWSGSTIVQPAMIPGGGVLISTSDMAGGVGTRRIAINKGADGWTVEERWTSNGLKPYFNDFVIHKGHAFGFDGNILACIDLEDGKRKWKGGRYGNGQLVLLADQDLLLVLSEEGELALVGASSDQYKELARVPAIEGKTWNHPVLAGDVLLVRNGEEMAAFKLKGLNH
jgi:outer membrane protein assembly factor BamB